MKLMGVTIGIAVLVGLIAAGCGRGTSERRFEQRYGVDARVGSARGCGTVEDINAGHRRDVQTEPDPPKVGENTFEAMVMAGGQPVTDAGASVELVMPAMPSMNMAEMRSTVALKHDGEAPADIAAPARWIRRARGKPRSR